MMIPEALQDALNKHTPSITSSISATVLPTVSSTSSVAPIPTVIPDLPDVQKIHATGARTLWAVFVIMVLASLVFTVMSWTIPVSRRIFHIITTLVTIIGSLSYFAMASGHGTFLHHDRIREPHPHVPDTYYDVYRQVFWARYVDWALTIPLLIVDLGLLAGLSGGHILLAISANIIMTLSGLFAAFGSEGTPQKWGWYAIACVSYLFVLWHLLLNGWTAASARGPKISSFYTQIAGFSLIVWTVYPIIWGISDGSRSIKVDSEVIAYAVLDLLAKVVFGTWLLLVHAGVPETNVEIGGFWANGLEGHGAVRLPDDDGP